MKRHREAKRRERKRGVRKKEKERKEEKKKIKREREIEGNADIGEETYRGKVIKR